VVTNKSESSNDVRAHAAQWIQEHHACRRESMPRLRWRQQGPKLFALYVLASLVPISVMGAVAVRGDTHSGTEFGLDWGRAQSAVIETSSSHLGR